jgi:hypothetical protein
VAPLRVGERHPVARAERTTAGGQAGSPAVVDGLGRSGFGHEAQR